MKKTILLSMAMLSQSLSMSAQTLTIKVCGVEKAEGHMLVALYSSKETYMKQPAKAFAVEVKDTTVTVPCKGLPTGEYAISLFHDANSNGQLDTGDYGIPTERYGFSNNPRIVMGPPTYDACRFSFADDTTIVVRLK